MRCSLYSKVDRLQPLFAGEGASKVVRVVDCAVNTVPVYLSLGDPLASLHPAGVCHVCMSRLTTMRECAWVDEPPTLLASVVRPAALRVVAGLC